MIMMTRMLKVIDDYLDPKTFSILSELFLSREMEWYWTAVIDDSDYYQFTHGMYSRGQPTSNKFSYILPLLDKLKAAAIIKIKANLNTKTQEIIEHGYHVDHPYSSGKTAILYLNTCNGYTAFEDGTIVNSVKNRIVIFDSSIKHTGTTVTDLERRVVLNINYFS